MDFANHRFLSHRVEIAEDVYPEISKSKYIFLWLTKSRYDLFLNILPGVLRLNPICNASPIPGHPYMWNYFLISFNTFSLNPQSTIWTLRLILPLQKEHIAKLSIEEEDIFSSSSSSKGQVNLLPQRVCASSS